MRKLMAGVVLALLVSSPAGLAAKGEVYPFQERLDSEPERNPPKVAALGEVTALGGARLPARALDVMEATTGAYTKDRPERSTLPIRLTPAQASRLTAWFTPHGWFLAPRGWDHVKGGIGADGTAAFTFAPASGPGYVSYSNSSACVGCAQGAASVLFAEARKDAIADDQPYYTSAQPVAHVVRLNPHLIAYRVPLAHVRLDGLMYYDNSQDMKHHQTSAALPPALQDLATPILNIRRR